MVIDLNSIIMKYLFRLFYIMLLVPISKVSSSQVAATTSSYGLYFRSNMGGDVTLDNNGKINPESNDLSGLQGTMFWNNEYSQAKLFLKSGSLLGVFPVKFNLFTQQFHVKNSEFESEKIIQDQYVSKIIFEGKINGFDSPTFTNEYREKIILTKGIADGYLMQLTSGPAIIYKRPRSVIMYKDSLFGTIKKPYLVVKDQYFISYKGGFEELKKNKYEQIAFYIPSIESCYNWFKLQKIKWNNDQDLIRAIEYFNSTQK